MTTVREQLGRVAAGGVYRSKRTGCRYVVLCFAFCGRTLQEQVVYDGLEGPDAGRWFVCPLADFGVKFEPAEAPPAVEGAPPLPEVARENGGVRPADRAAGAVASGSGV